MKMKPNYQKLQKSTTRGKVMSITDPAGGKKIAVHIPELNDDDEVTWCYCTLWNKPAVNDMVIVSYENNDVSIPVVTGNLTQAMTYVASSSTSTTSSGDLSTITTNKEYLQLIAKLIWKHEVGTDTPSDESYTSITPQDTSEGISLGLFQWHCDNAREIIAEIKSRDNATWVSCGGDSLSRSLSASWYGYVPGTADQAILKALLGSSTGHAVQDDKVLEYLAGYVQDAIDLGMTNLLCIAYYADCANAGPEGMKSVIKAMTSDVYNDLDNLHNTIYNSGKFPADHDYYKTARLAAYNQLKQWESEGVFDQFTISSITGGGDIVLEEDQLLWPAPGYPVISYRFGYQTPSYGGWHNGVDINSTGKTVSAYIDGAATVAACDGTAYFYWNVASGNTVRIKRTGKEFYCIYMHLKTMWNGSGYSSFTSAMGTVTKEVCAGDTLGYIDNTGTGSDGTHLHFEVRDGGLDCGKRTSASHGYIVDPEPYLLADGVKPTKTETTGSTTGGTKITGGYVSSCQVTYSNGAYRITNYALGNQTGPEVIIANKTYALSSSYNPNGLTSACQSAFNKMKSAATKEGYGSYCTIKSGFRSYSTQQSTYQGWVSTYGSQTKADAVSARAGHSEHQTGLAIDIYSVTTSDFTTGVCKNFYAWLKKEAYKYGFILRYPDGKKSKTGYEFEPWHWRYVGTTLATYLYNYYYKNGNWICLEEFFGITSKYS